MTEKELIVYKSRLKKWEKKGDAVIFKKLNLNICDLESLQKICECLNAQKLFVYESILLNDFRSPKLRMLYGTDSTIVHKENGIKYKFDLEKNMFSSGNVNERVRMGSLSCETEVVVDMFAGIGYFTLPLLKGSRAKMVYAYDWNPDALEYLKENLKLNGIDEGRCTIRSVDNRKITDFNMADRVVLGLIPSSRLSWLTALRTLRYPQGGTLHIHENCDILSVQKSLQNHLTQILLSREMEAKELDWDLNGKGPLLTETTRYSDGKQLDPDNILDVNEHHRNKDQAIIVGDPSVLTSLISILPICPRQDFFDGSDTVSLSEMCSRFTQTNLHNEIGFMTRGYLMESFAKSCYFNIRVFEKLTPLPTFQNLVETLKNLTETTNAASTNKILCLTYWILTIGKILCDHCVDIKDQHENLRTNNGGDTKIIFQRLTRVKSYGPAITHYVMDVDIRF